MTGETLGESAQVPLVVACGALVSELRAVFAANAMADAIEVRYLPAPLHNRPEGIVPAIRDVLAAAGAADPTTTTAPGAVVRRAQVAKGSPPELDEVTTATSRGPSR